MSQAWAVSSPEKNFYKKTTSMQNHRAANHNGSYLVRKDFIIKTTVVKFDIAFFFRVCQDRAFPRITNEEKLATEWIYF